MYSFLYFENTNPGELDAALPFLIQLTEFFESMKETNYYNPPESSNEQQYGVFTDINTNVRKRKNRHEIRRYKIPFSDFNLN